VALDAGVVGVHVGEVPVVGLALVFVATLRKRAVLRGCGGVVVDVDEAKILTDGIVIHAGFFDAGVHTYRGLAALVTLHTAGFIAQAGEFDTRRHHHAVHLHGDVVMAGHTGDDRANGCRLVDHAGLRAVGGLRRGVGVARALPKFQEGGLDGLLRFHRDGDLHGLDDGDGCWHLAGAAGSQDQGRAQQDQHDERSLFHLRHSPPLLSVGCRWEGGPHTSFPSAHVWASRHGWREHLAYGLWHSVQAPPSVMQTCWIGKGK